jgi:hypothetical protein
MLGMFFIYRWCTPPDGLYGITDRSISVDRDLYGPIGIQEVFTFNSKKTKPREPFILNFSPFVWFPFGKSIFLSRNGW